MPLLENKTNVPWGRGSSGLNRFWKRTEKRDAESCWLWTGYQLGGYGGFWVARKFYYAHRYSWQLHFGDIPEGICVLHDCDTPLCVNPRHLFLGTNLDNIKDRDKKERQCRGEDHHCAKLTEDDIRLIRSLYQFNKRGRGATALGRKFGVSKVVILGIVNGTSWKHVQ